jgi:cytochrome c1
LPRHDLILLLVAASAACKPPPATETAVPLASAERGQRAIERVGCGACHTIDGIAWPRGKTAPALADFDRRGLIAGQLPARPDVLAAFVRDAPSLVPGTAMPAMPLTEAEARDVAAYLMAMGR